MPNIHQRLVLLALSLIVAFAVAPLHAEPPHATYIFPAGGQRGTTVKFRVGGNYFHEKAPFTMIGLGVQASREIQRAEKTIWFEGPVTHSPENGKQEDYPKDYLGQATVAANAPLGVRFWRVSNSQGVTPAMRFIVGDLPEIVEEEIDGQPLPVTVKLPLTINARIFPREDTDQWVFDAPAGRWITCVVAAKQIGSPLGARLEVRDPAGHVVAESTNSVGPDPILRFQTGKAGTYRVNIRDTDFGGLQHYVYRLTITDGPWIDQLYPLGGRRGEKVQLTAIGQNVSSKPMTVQIPSSASSDFPSQLNINGKKSNPILLAVDDLPEQLEAEPNDTADQAKTATAPTIVNGRIDRPGDVDCWAIHGVKGQPLELKIQASRLGSRLDSVLTVLDEAGKQLATNDDFGGTVDAKLRFTPKADGRFIVQVAEQFSSRGGKSFAYRLRIAPPEAPSFRLQIAVDALTIERGKEQKLQINLQRLGGFKEPIKISAEGLPAGISIAEVEAKGNQSKIQLLVKADEKARINVSQIRIAGKAEVDEKTISQTATFATARGESIIDSLTLAVAMPTPFTFAGQYAFNFVPRGSIHHEPFAIERNGYQGPFEVKLADRQGRHLQGVSGSTLTVPAGATEFTYPIYLPPWMELGRTSRSVIMLTGQVKDEEGRIHKVCYTIGTQNDQIICRVSPSLIRLVPERKNLMATPEGSAELRVQVKRDASLTSPIQLGLAIPQHMSDIVADPVTVLPGQQEATLTIRFGKSPGPINMPLLIRATGRKNGDRVIGETSLELVTP